MMQPKAVIRPTSLVEIPLQGISGGINTNYGFIGQSTSVSQSSLPQLQTVERIEIKREVNQSYVDGNLQQQQVTTVTEIPIKKNHGQTQVTQGYPVQSQPFPQQIILTNANQGSHINYQRPPIIVQPGGEILNPSLRQVLGHKSSSVKCPQCYHQVMTKVDYEPNGTTHCLAFILFIFLCWVCCCIPYCLKGTRNAQHSCPVCGVFLGLHEVELC